MMFDEAIEKITSEEYDAIEDGKIPSSIEKIADIDPVTFNFVSKEYPDVVLGTIYDIMDAQQFQREKRTSAIEATVNDKE